MSNEIAAAVSRAMKSEEHRTCLNCAFALKEQAQPPNIGSHFVCRFMPPQLVVMPSAQGAQLVTMFPIVNERMICQQHTLMEHIENAPRALPNG